MIYYLEKLLKRPLTYNICQLHFVELPFRALFKFHDGETEGKCTFKGPIGKEIQRDDLTEGFIKPFKPIKGLTHLLPTVAEIKLANKDKKGWTINSDQQTALELAHAISRGQKAFEDYPMLARRSPGKCNHSRWLTRANHIMRFYVSQDSPSKELIRLVKSGFFIGRFIVIHILSWV